MAASNSTTNYALPIYIATDKTDWLTTFNGAMNTIDAQMFANATKASQNETKITNLTNKVNGMNTFQVHQNNATVAPETWTTIDSIQVADGGKYLVKGTIMYQSNSTGARMVWIGNDASGGTINSRYQTSITPAISGYVTIVTIIHAIALDPGDTIYLRGYHSSSINLTGSGALEVIRLSD